MKALAWPLRRPIATGSIYAGLAFVAAFALRDLPLSLAPDLEYPGVSVQLRWGPATPEAMEALVTSKVEAEAERLPGVREVSSVSGRGFAGVDVRFERGTRMDRAEALLRERIGALRASLPADLAPPEITAYQSDEFERVPFLALRADGPRTAESLRTLLEDRLLPRLLAVPGVSGGRVHGGGVRELRIDLDRDAFARGIVDPAGLDRALAEASGAVSLGSVRRDGLRLPVVLSPPPATPETVRRAIVNKAGDRPLRLGEVAEVWGSWSAPRRIVRVDGTPAVGLLLEREPGTNLLSVAREVKAALRRASPSLPPEVRVEIVYDQSERIARELWGLGRRAALSVAAIFLVLVLAQRRARAPLVVLVSVLFSALFTFLLFRIAGLGMNLVTLSGIALSFGMAVDTSIVLLQNITLRARGRSRSLWTLAATREVLLPLLAGTLTTAVVMVPFLYLSGDLRTYYLPFVGSVCLALVASLVVSLTATPLLSNWALAPKRMPVLSARGSALESLYERLARPLLKRPWIVIVTSAFLFAGSIWAFRTQVTRGAIFPNEADTGLRVSVGLPEGMEIEETEAVLSRFEEAALSHPFRQRGYIERVELRASENRGQVSVLFEPGIALTAVPEAIKEELTVLAAALFGGEISVSGFGPGFSSSRSRSTPSYQLTLRGPDYLTLKSLSEDLRDRLAREPRIREIDSNASDWMVEGASELALHPDRERLAQFGLSMREFVSFLQPAVAAELAGRSLRSPEGDLPARVRMEGGRSLARESLLAAVVPIPSGVGVSADHLCDVVEQPIQPEIRRRNQEYERSITFDYRGPRAIGNRFVRAFVEHSELPAGYSLIDGLGLFLTRVEERDLSFALGLALLLIYMTAAALFESFWIPFVALFAVPLSFIGIVTLFWATGETFDRTAYVGLILLSGIAINNALLLSHRAGRLLSWSGDPVTAALRAARERARPILITAVTSAAGLLPLALGTEAGSADTWRALALSASAGLLASAVVSLTVVPALFVALARLSGRGPVRRSYT